MIIAIANQKGGTGKTTTALNLGAGLNKAGYKVLLVDLDLQMDLTLGLAIPEAKFTSDDVMNGKDINKAIVRLDNGLSVIPASKDLRVTQMGLRKHDILKKALDSVKGKYDFIILDTNPGITILTINAILTSNMILIPILAEYFSIRGLVDFKETIAELQEAYGINPEIKILIANFDVRKGLHKDAVALVKKHFKQELLKTHIRTNVALAESVSQAGKTIFEYAPGSHGAEDYNKLQKEIRKGIK